VGNLPDQSKYGCYGPDERWAGTFGFFLKSAFTSL